MEDAKKQCLASTAGEGTGTSSLAERQGVSTCGRRERVWKVARPVRSGARFLPTVWVIVSLGVARLPVAVAVGFQSSLSLPDSLRRRSSPAMSSQPFQNVPRNSKVH